MRNLLAPILCATALTPSFAVAAEADASADQRTIVVTAAQEAATTSTKTNTPIVQIPQPITVIDDKIFLAQGAVSIGDTLNYVSGVTANPYGPDSRVDGAFVRGINALQFRDGMRDIFSFYASIRADPYNFEQVELVRGPASVLFGQGALGGIVNLVSKRPEFETHGEASVRYGSFDRKEVMLDLTGPLDQSVAARLVARVRNAKTQTDFVPDDRVMVSPSITFKPSSDTTFTLIGLYQEDDGGSTSQFLPLVGTILPNPNGTLSNGLFVGKPGWDRYDGRLLQGTALLEQRFGENARINLKARYIDSDLAYFTHYPDNYTNPTNPFLDANQRIMGLYVDGSIARMEIFSTDNNLQIDFNTGSAIRHTLLAGVDYSANSVNKTGGFAYETFDIYNIDYGALSDYGGGLPTPTYVAEDVDQDQLGIYLQDQIRLHDRVSVVFGARRDWTQAKSFGGAWRKDSATTFRAGIIGEVATGISPFFSYTESFEPIAGTASDGTAFIPKAGRQVEVGIKFHPADTMLVTLTGYHIRESNRPVSDDSTVDPFDQVQIGALTSKGVEFEGRVSLVGSVNLIANASYNQAEADETRRQIDNVPKFNASLWATTGIALNEETALLLGGGVRHVGSQRSFGPAFPDGVRTPGFTLADALVELSWRKWAVTLNATNLFRKSYYSACLARGDCFMGSERNVMGTVSYRF
ncbi:MAG: TonB-dependent siderophore receptor [Novosphingobium sp.]|uniref:TonB-dependent siderophore receptor n=1 Tax=Novosphingobium sp. TaxID=1874826 RepID=UPI00273453AB|nr:TonB-dependent siderophore receptor [Novosphingobium sp.]MDP3551140.1 TonB-dependent siderophore receptor [Novosphingobium sp.]